MERHPDAREIKVGVTLYPSYVEDCIIGYTDLYNIGANCTEPGISVKVFVALQEALRHKFHFSLVRINESIGSWNAIVDAFDKGQVDLSIDLWTKNVRRVQQAYLSEPLIYKRRSFLTSNLNSNVQQTEMDILPLAWQVVLCFGVAAFLIALILSSAKLIQSGAGTGQPVVVRAFLFYDFAMVSLWKLGQVLIKQPVGLKKFNKSWSTTLAWFPWFFGGVALVGMYDAVVTTELLPSVQLPFKDSLGLAAKIEARTFQLIVEDPSAPFYQLVETSSSPVYRALNRSLSLYPKRIFSTQDVLRRLRSDAHFVYAANTVAAKFIMGQECDLIEIEDLRAEFSGLNLAFPLNSSLAAEFREAVVRIHSVIDRMIKEVGNNRCLKQNVDVSPMPLAYLTTAFLYCGVGLAAALVVFFLERPWRTMNRQAKVASRRPSTGGALKQANKRLSQNEVQHSLWKDWYLICFIISSL